MPKAKTRLEYILNPNMRLPRGIKEPGKKREALLAWIHQAKFKNRRPTPDELVAECRKKSSPLYSLIEVDDRRAASIYRRQIAQYYLRHINVVRVNVVTKEHVGGPVVAYQPVEITSGGRILDKDYIPAGRISEDAAFKSTVLLRAANDMEAWIQRYERYAEFFGVFAPVIDAFRHVQKQLNTTLTNGNGNGKAHNRKSKIGSAR